MTTSTLFVFFISLLALTKPNNVVCADVVDPNCPSRESIIKCAATHLDTNKNQKLEEKELDDAIGSLPWYARGVLKIIGSTKLIMKKCDYDKDGAIDMVTDMEATKDTCLATCFKKKAFKSAFFPDCGDSVTVETEL
eukprot:CAMPEP_0194277900 /NCGR_PEP_ID=MMETSP0169-20130528/10093_1 /TAXON_ID=218684 /ORGANISM="Corethron pennatum, Strain L29A3" /LENGTH=136 /DNA_ID=CAMNT_0039021969 /DNA_START=78 /DNA_END=488 /DNA_ORIENTATION=-